jgi:outer membrane protein insertion porin family
MLYLVLMPWCQAASEPVITSIRFEGNERTRESVLRREMYIREGDELDYGKVEKSIQGIRDMGLFKKVGYYLEQNQPAAVDEASGIELVITLEEKIYTLIIPRVRVQDNQTRIGVNARLDNLFGLDHSMRYIVERKGTVEGVDEYRQRLSYYYPNVNGSRYSVNFSAVDENTVTEQIDNSLENSLNKSFALVLHKWLNPGQKKVGDYISAGVSHTQRTHETLDGVYIDETLANAMVFEYGYRKVHEMDNMRDGRHYGYSVEWSNEAFGSDAEYFKNLLFYRSYYTFDSRPGDNLNVQLQLGYSSNDILGDEAFTLDFRNDLRGYERDRFTGNSMVLLNLEYMTPSSFSRKLRYVGFVDIGNTYDSEKRFQPDGLNAGLGVGIRWKIPSLVKVDLRIDLGYGIADENYQTTVGTHYAF